MPNKNDDDRSRVCNPKDSHGGPGRPEGYHGKGDKADLDNHGNQLNPNNERYQGK